MDKAFVDDPTVTWVSLLPEVFESEHHRYVAMCAEPAFAANTVYASNNFEAAAIWYPPGVAVHDDDYECFKQSVRFPDKIQGLGELAMACDQFRPTSPHWTLELIAVDPAVHSKGLGRALMLFGLAICDQQNLPTFLVSSNVRNLPFYERLGFEAVGEVRLTGKPAMFPMLRRPRPTHSFPAFRNAVSLLPGTNLCIMS